MSHYAYYDAGMPAGGWPIGFTFSRLFSTNVKVQLEPQDPLLHIQRRHLKVLRLPSSEWGPYESPIAHLEAVRTERYRRSRRAVLHYTRQRDALLGLRLLVATHPFPGIKSDRFLEMQQQLRLQLFNTAYWLLGVERSSVLRRHQQKMVDGVSRKPGYIYEKDLLPPLGFCREERLKDRHRARLHKEFTLSVVCERVFWGTTVTFEVWEKRRQR